METNHRTERIINATCRVFDVSREALFSKARHREVADARKAIVYFMRRHSGMTLKQLGALFGRHHASVLHMARAGEFLAQNDAEFRRRIEGIQTDIMTPEAVQ